MAEPWIRVHANLHSKPVVFRAMTALGVLRAEAVGLLVSFWGQASQHAPNGQVGDYPDAQLEAWAGWERKRGRFAEFIRSVHLDAEGRVNEWDEYAGALEEQRRQARERMRTVRKRSPDVREQEPERSRTFSPTRRDDTKREDSSSPAPTEPSVPDKPKTWRPALETVLADRLPSDQGRIALAAVLHLAPNRLAWVAELGAMLEAMGGHVPASPEQLEEALREFVSARTPTDPPPSLAHFKAFVERIVTRPTRKPARPEGRQDAGRAALVFGQIKGLIRESRQPGQSVNRFIPRREIEALGDDVVAAYDAIGGAERVLGASGDQLGFVIRDFTNALEASHRG